MQLDIRKSKETADTDEILQLRKIVFPREDTEKQDLSCWEWEFRGNFFGEAEVFIARNEEGLVGHYALIPQEYALQGDTARGGLAVDAMVHPRFRRKGIFSSLQEYALKNTAADFAIGYTLRKTILPAEIKGGYRVVKQVPVYIFPLDFQRLLARYVSSKALTKTLGSLLSRIYGAFFSTTSSQNSFDIERVTDIAARAGVFLERYRNRHQIFLKKNTGYLAWRFDRPKMIPYEKFIVTDKKDKSNIVAYFVLRNKEIMGLPFRNIVDLEMMEPDPELFASIMQYIVASAKKNSCSGVAYMLLDDGSLSRQARAFGMMRCPYTLKLILHNTTDTDFIRAFRGSKSVHLNWSDTDLM